MSQTPAKPTPVSDFSSAPVNAARRHLAWVHCLTHFRPGSDEWPAWLAACHRLTPHLQRFGPNAALLDLGNCTDAEAQAAMQSLITWLQIQQITVRAAIASSGILAQFALLHAPAHEPLTLLPAEQAPALLHEMPITALARLQFADPITRGTHSSLTPKALAQVVATLDGYGIRTLAQLARFDEARLRRQFGARLGASLLAVAWGEDVFPFQPTPAPLQLHFRLRLKAPLAADRLLAALKPLTREVAAKLARRGLQAHTLEMRLCWESGAEQRTARTLPQPIAGGRTIHETVLRLLTPLVQSHAGSDTIADFHLIVSHLVPRYPVQHAFWPQRTRRVAALDHIADVLAQRHGKPLLLRSKLSAPDAIFDQDRSQFAPLTPDASAKTAPAADVLEGQGQHAARPAADVADDAADTPDASAEIPHGVHWW